MEVKAIDWLPNNEVKLTRPAQLPKPRTLQLTSVCSTDVETSLRDEGKAVAWHSGGMTSEWAWRPLACPSLCWLAGAEVREPRLIRSPPEE